MKMRGSLGTVETSFANKNNEVARIINLFFTPSYFMFERRPEQKRSYITDKVTKEPLSDDGCRLAGPYGGPEHQLMDRKRSHE